MQETDLKALLDVIDGRTTTKPVMYTAVVTKVEADQSKASVKFPTDETEFTFLNKSGDKLTAGDSVYIYAPNGDLSAAYIDIKFGVSNGSAYRFVYSITMPNSGWSTSVPYTRTLSVPGVKSSDIIHATPTYSATRDTRMAQKTAWDCVTFIQANNNSITLYCDEVQPTTSVPVKIEIMR